MIIVIEGLGVGAGKSFLTLTKLMVHFCAGGTAFVVDTFQLKWENVKKYCYDHYGYVLEDDQYRSVPEDQILEIHKHTSAGTDECPVVIVLDEVQGQLNARDWNDKRRKDLFSWACQSRHDSNDVWFISQSAANIDKQVRRLATYTFRVRNTKNWGNHVITKFLWLARKLTFGLHPGAYFIVRQLDADGRTPMGKPKWLEQDPALFNCYISKAMAGKHQRDGAVIPKRKLARKQTKTPYFRWAIAAVVIGLLVVGCSGCKQLWPSKTETPAKSVAPAPASGSPGASPAKPAFDVRAEKFRSEWGRYRLSTDAWVYQKGRLSPDGMVEDISDGQVRIRQADGRPLFILGDKRPDSGRVAAAIKQTPSPTPGKIIVARDAKREEAEALEPAKEAIAPRLPMATRPTLDGR